jgi:antitoxin HicB
LGERVLTYTIVLTPEPDGSAFTVTVPALPGVMTWGFTTEEALASAREAIELHLENYVERGQPLPEERRMPGGQTCAIAVEPPISSRR